MSKSYLGLYGVVEALRKLIGIRVTATSSYDIETQIVYLLIEFPDHTVLLLPIRSNDDPVTVFKSLYPEYCI